MDQLEQDNQKKLSEIKLVIKQLQQEFVITTHSNSKELINFIHDGRLEVVSNSHLLNRANSLLNYKYRITASYIISKLRHVVGKKYDPSSEELLIPMSSGFYQLNMYRRPNAFNDFSIGN